MSGRLGDPGNRMIALLAERSSRACDIHLGPQRPRSIFMMSAIEVEDLRKVYRSKTGDSVRALDGVSFQVPQSHIYGLLGPNGAGKSTLVQILSTITSPTSGRASVLGFDVARQPLETRRQLAVVLQHTATENLVIWSTALKRSNPWNCKSTVAQSRWFSRERRHPYSENSPTSPARRRSCSSRSAARRSKRSLLP